MGSAGASVERPVVTRLHPAQEREPGGRRVGRDVEAGRRRGVERDRVDARQDLEVLLEQSVTLGVVGRTGEVDAARESRSMTSASGSSQSP